MTSYSQANQDRFVLSVLQNKQNGVFLEIGSNHPIEINNTYLLETEYKWSGILVELDPSFLPLYQQHRPASLAVLQDATTIDYVALLQKQNAPPILEYLQIDLHEENGSTLQTLQRLDSTVFDSYTFRVVTFEHDIYRSNVFNTREESRKIFKARGYLRLFSDVKYLENAFEDWYVHPSCVDIQRLQGWATSDSLESSEILRRINASPSLS